MDAPPTPVPAPKPESVPALSERLVDELLTELRSERASMREQNAQLARERKSERRWKIFFQFALFGLPLLGMVAYIVFFSSAMGFHWGPFGRVVGVVRIDGEISSTGLASAKRVVPVLKKAFENPSVKAVVLSIDSPGGAPAEAERIYGAIEHFKAKHQKPVLAVINNMGASAAYMIALHADKIVAGKYSLVGSVGAIMAPWDLHKAIKKFDISQRVYASGKLKSFLNPFAPLTEDADTKARQLIATVGTTFLDELKKTRAGRLKPGVDYGTGEVWVGEEAKELGLVDDIGTLDEVVATTWNLKAYEFGPNPESFGLFSASLQSVSQGVADAVLRQLTISIR